VLVVGEVVRLAGALAWFRETFDEAVPFRDSGSASAGVKAAS
jgi:hypothetical protein